MDPNPFLQVIQACNKFDDDWANMWRLELLDNSKAIGYIPNDFFEDLDWEGTSFIVNKDTKTVHLDTDPRPEPEARSAFCVEQFVRLCENNQHKFNGVLKDWLTRCSCFSGIRWLDDLKEVIPIPSPLRGILGVTTAGVHLNVFTELDDGRPAMWVSRRSRLYSYPDMYDQISAGGMRPIEGYKVWETLKRSAWEEAHLRVDGETRLVTTKAGVEIGKVRGPYRITFYDKKAEHVSDEVDHLEPGCRWVFDLDVSADCDLMPSGDDSINYFCVMSIDGVKRSLLAGEWKPNSGLTTLASLVRRGHVEDKDRQLRHGLQVWRQIRNEREEARMRGSA